MLSFDTLCPRSDIFSFHSTLLKRQSCELSHTDNTNLPLIVWDRPLVGALMTCVQALCYFGIIATLASALGTLKLSAQSREFV